MTDFQLYKELTSLPDELRKEVQNFIQFLKSKTPKTQPPKERKFGAAKGFFKMQDDFNEPLEDFKEYM